MYRQPICFLRVVGGGGRGPDEALREAVELVVHGGHANSYDPPAATRGAGITPPDRESASFMVGTTTVSDRLRTSDFRS